MMKRGIPVTMGHRSDEGGFLPPLPAPARRAARRRRREPLGGCKHGAPSRLLILDFRAALASARARPSTPRCRQFRRGCSGPGVGAARPRPARARAPGRRLGAALRLPLPVPVPTHLRGRLFLLPPPRPPAFLGARPSSSARGRLPARRPRGPRLLPPASRAVRALPPGRCSLAPPPLPPRLFRRLASPPPAGAHCLQDGGRASVRGTRGPARGPGHPALSALGKGSREAAPFGRPRPPSPRPSRLGASPAAARAQVVAAGPAAGLPPPRCSAPGLASAAAAPSRPPGARRPPARGPCPAPGLRLRGAGSREGAAARPRAGGRAGRRPAGAPDGARPPSGARGPAGLRPVSGPGRSGAG